MKLVEIQPSSPLTTASVLSRRSWISFCWFSGSTVRMLIRMVTFFVTSMVVFMVFSSGNVVLCRYTMKTIPLIRTDRSLKNSADQSTLVDYLFNRGAARLRDASSSDGAATAIVRDARG